MSLPRSSSNIEHIRSIPKVELHAHLSGSISQDYLTQFLREKNFPDDTFAKFNVMEDLDDSMAKCFSYFDSVAKVIRSVADVEQCALHVLEEFARDNCIYLELRTTAKSFPIDAAEGGGEHGFTTKDEYIEAVRRAYERFVERQREEGIDEKDVMQLKLLYSIDRGRADSLEQARAQVRDMVRLCDRFSDFIVGVDVCGNPAKPTIIPCVIPSLLEVDPAFFARFPVTFHTAEVQDDEEAAFILQHLDRLNIRRLGHVCYLSQQHREQLFAQVGERVEREGRQRQLGSGSEDEVPSCFAVELCPTSNLVTKKMADMKEHHFGDWWKRSRHVNCCLCTDDTGLFCCDLSSELAGLCDAFMLDADKDVWELQKQAARSCFLRGHERKQLMKRLADPSPLKRKRDLGLKSQL